MEIKEFLKNHPFISVHAIERAMNIPTGTIRITTDRAIPSKYKDEIISLLKDYGWINNDVHNFDIKDVPKFDNDHSTAVRDTSEVIAKSVTNNNEYYVKNKSFTISDKKGYCILFRKKDNIEIRAESSDIPDGSKVIVIDK